MVNPTHIVPTSFFYAVGNTPAVNLTRSLPPDQDADVLLLGCGDVRNILFSVYTGAGSGRRMDFTCCDIESEVLARNIILFTLILDDTENNDAEKIWNIYYHVLVDEDSLHLLREQASKLQKVAGTAEEWNKSKYGHTLRFCDSYTFSQVLRLWKSYALQPSDGQPFKEQQEHLQHSTQKARDIQKQFVGDNMTFSGLRSAAPRSDCAIDDVPASYETFWKTGSSRLRQSSKPTNLNPMFGTTNSRFYLHYGTDPVIGYHLATAYTGLSPDSPLKGDPAKGRQMGKCFNAALDQFHAFVKAFRKSASHLTIRFIVTDALGLCHTLKHIQHHGNSSTVGWYRSFRTWEPLTLDTADYSQEKTGAIAPLLFDVVDTSNLVDHFGCLNLLTAAGPLLKPKPTSTLSTELLVRRELNIDQYKKNLLFGDLQSVALLFSLVPVEIWTGTTSDSGFDERVISDVGGGRGAGAASQSRFILHWKSSAIPTEGASRSSPDRKLSSLTFDAKELARHLFQIYQGMFHDEDHTNWLSGSRERLQRKPYGHYTRASFAAILSHIRVSNMVDWPNFMNQLYDLIGNDSACGPRACYAAELTVHLDHLGLRPMVWSELPSRLHIGQSQCPLRHWTSVPPTLCITMVVPRQKLRIFRDDLSRMGSPVVQMVLRATDMRAQSFYMDIQAGFGHLKTLGNRYSESLALEVQDDERKWDGIAPMIVSAMVPSSIALQKPDLSTEVLFALSQSPHSFSVFGEELGLDLAISRSTLAGQDVYITKTRPNMVSPLSLSGITNIPPVANDKPVFAPSEPSMEESQTRFHAQLSPSESKLQTVMAHVDIPPGQLQDTLRSAAAVQVSQASSFEISISFDKKKPFKRVRFPAPISMTGSKTRVARKSSYIEFIASVASQKELSARPDSLYLTVQERGSLGLCSLHYVLLDRLPILGRQDPSQLSSWMVPRLVDMFSFRERKAREIHMASNLDWKDARGNFKESIISLFTRFAGINDTKRNNVLALNNPQNGGVHMFIFISSIRLDMSCQNLVLDAAVLPLTMDIMSSMIPVIEALQKQGVVSVNVDNEELLLWKHALPALVERCRDWKHSSSCEYATSGKAPISVGFGENPICSCGNGKFPPGYKVQLPGIWEKVAKHAVRVAIPPCFSVPFVEKPFDTKDFDKLEEWHGQASFEGAMKNGLEELRLKKGSCFRCDKEEANSDSLLRCGGCKVAEYCSTDCQRTDWKEGKHKILCPVLGNK